MVPRSFSDDAIVDDQFLQRYYIAPNSASKQNYVPPANTKVTKEASQTEPLRFSQGSNSNQHQRYRSFGFFLSNDGPDFGRTDSYYDRTLQSSERSFIEIHEDDGRDSSLDVVTHFKNSGSRQEIVSLDMDKGSL
jgi:hypothetical protein